MIYVYTSHFLQQDVQYIVRIYCRSQYLGGTKIFGCANVDLVVYLINYIFKYVFVWNWRYIDRNILLSSFPVSIVWKHLTISFSPVHVLMKKCSTYGFVLFDVIFCELQYCNLRNPEINKQIFL